MDNARHKAHQEYLKAKKSVLIQALDTFLADHPIWDLLEVLLTMVQGSNPAHPMIVKKAQIAQEEAKE